MNKTFIALALTSAVYAANGMKMTIYDSNGQKILSEDVQKISALTFNTPYNANTPVAKPDTKNLGSMQFHLEGQFLFLDLNGASGNNFEVRILDVQGKEVFSKNGQLNKLGQITITALQIKPGAFFIQTRIGDEHFSQNIHFVQ